MKPRRIYPTKHQQIANRGYFKNKRLTYRGRKMVFDKDIRKGNCQLCKKSTQKKEITRTVLHHLKHDNSNPLAWTIEICPSCHYKVDEKNKTRIDMFYENR